MAPVKVIIAGCGGRGRGYATYAKDFPEKMQIVGIAEPQAFYRKQMRDQYGIDEANIFSDWKDLAAREKFAQAVIIGTQDAMHVEPAVAFSAKGYHILLEKPMAPSPDGCRTIAAAIRDSGVMFGVCHVLRYTTYTKKLKELLTTGTIGDIISIQHLEPVGYWHQAHSFVRGAWRNEAESSFMLLAKSCHDIDWLAHIADSPCDKVTSYGSLKHFRRECQPAGAADRCVDCPAAVADQCPYHAVRFYNQRLEQVYTDHPGDEKSHLGWPVTVVTPDLGNGLDTDRAALLADLKTGPYGRCVYACDNDVVDHQVVNLLYTNGITATFTMTAFTDMAGRATRIFGTHGSLEGDSEKIIHRDFLTNSETVIDTATADTSILGGHGGGDLGLMEAFIGAVASNDPSKILSGIDESLDTHLTVFAAEQARRDGVGLCPAD